MRQFRVYEKSQSTDRATSPEAIGVVLAANKTLMVLLQDLVTVVRLFLLLPGTTCSPKRSFSSLRRLKTYLKATMTQKRLNHLAFISSHKDIVDALELDEVVDEWRTGVTVRENAV